MSSITAGTRATVKAHLEVFVENLVERYRGRAVESMEGARQYLSLKDKKGGLQPFHAALVPSEVLRISAFQRGFVTSIGTSLEECARLIASDHHREAKRSYDLRGYITDDALNEIEQQVAKYERAAADDLMPPSLDDMISRVLELNKKGARTVRSYKADLYVLSHDGTRFYFEMKSPKPNKDQCVAVTRRILMFHAICNSHRPQVQSYFAMSYNPYGNSRSDYNWSIAKKYLPYDNGLLIGSEFWNLIGGATAYEELLEIYRDVGRVKGKYIVDALAFGF